jgi:hypothetical protein
MDDLIKRIKILHKERDRIDNELRDLQREFSEQSRKRFNDFMDKYYKRNLKNV